MFGSWKSMIKKRSKIQYLHEKGNDIINNGRRVVIVLW
jgi:hypothetical protein